MMNLQHYSRWKAAAAHLAISAAIAAVTLTVMLFLWYPPPLFSAMGGQELIVLIVGVDVTIGPLITLIIFNPRKKELLFDLSVVVALQLAALLYGVYAMHAGRPAVIAFVENRFATVSAAEFEASALAEASRPEFRSLSQTGPTWVYVDMPNDAAAREQILFAGVGGLGAQHLPKYYVPYAERKAAVAGALYPLSRLDALGEENRSRLQDAIKRSGRAAAALGYVPLTAKFGVMTALVDATSGEVIEILPFSPLGAS
jgi:hypothetical protein